MDRDLSLTRYDPGMSPQFRQVRLNVCALVSEEENAAVLKVLERLGKLGVTTFRDQGCVLHCTLFMTEYPEDVKGQLPDVVRDNTAGERAFEVKCEGMSAPGGGWLFLDLDRRPLQEVADRLADALQPWRAKNPQRPSWLMPGTRKDEMFTEYGSPNVRSEFNPHISLACVGPQESLEPVLRDEELAALCSEVRTVQLRGIGLTEADDMGQFTRADLVGVWR
ncbi:hypothetical protein ACXR0O_10035 [Verrucomicrobiota bacterium sgz303538]